MHNIHHTVSTVSIVNTLHRQPGWLNTLCPEKRPKCFFVISPTKLGQFWCNLVHSLLSKFAAKWCKRFPPYLNNVSTLPCESWNARCACATIELLQKETPEFVPPQLWPPNLEDLNTVDNSVWEILQEVYKHASLIWSYRRRHWQMAASMTKWSSLAHSILTVMFKFVQISDACFVRLLLQYSPHVVINWIQIWRIWKPQVELG